MTPQYFKASDTLEKQFDDAGKPIFDTLSMQLDLFLEGAYETAPLGDLIFDNLRSPLSNAINRAIFRLAFTEIFQAFVEVGTFEAYLTVFKKIFGDDVDVQFTVPAVGKLEIDILANSVELTDFIARYIADNDYVIDEVIDDEGDNIAFQSIKGFTSEYELQQMLFEMVPDGIYTVITLTLAS